MANVKEVFQDKKKLGLFIGIGAGVVAVAVAVLVICLAALSPKTVTLDPNNTEEVITIEVKHNEVLPEVATPVNEGYEFVGWAENGQLVDLTQPITRNMNLVAQWTKTWTVRFVVEDETYALVTVYDGQKVDRPENPTFEDANKSFTGWYHPDIPDQEFDFENNLIHQDETIYASVFTRVPLESASFGKSSYTMEVGDTIYPNVTINPNNTTDVLEFRSSDASVVTISGDKHAVAALKVGTAKITIVKINEDNSETKVAEATVTVNPKTVAVESVSLGATYTFTDKNKYFAPTITIAPENATNKELTFASSDETVATVSEEGIVKSVGPGTCKITATAANGVVGELTINVDGFKLELILQNNQTLYYSADQESLLKYELYGYTWKDGKYNKSSYASEATFRVINAKLTDACFSKLYKNGNHYLYLNSTIDQDYTVNGYFVYNGVATKTFSFYLEKPLQVNAKSSSKWATNYVSTISNFDGGASVTMASGSYNHTVWITFNQPIEGFTVMNGASVTTNRTYEIYEQDNVTYYRFRFTDKGINYQGNMLVVDFYTEAGQTIRVTFNESK